MVNNDNNVNETITQSQNIIILNTDYCAALTAEDRARTNR